MKKTGPTNPRLKEKIDNIHSAGYEKNIPLFKDISNELRRSTRSRVEVNVKDINRVCEDGDVIAVPGKVLGAGVVNKKITVYGWRISESARKKIEEAGGETKSIEELVNDHPEGSGVRLIK